MGRNLGISCNGTAVYMGGLGISVPPLAFLINIYPEAARKVCCLNQSLVQQESPNCFPKELRPHTNAS